jgi:hypothetical protein
LTRTLGRKIDNEYQSIEGQVPDLYPGATVPVPDKAIALETINV